MSSSLPNLSEHLFNGVATFFRTALDQDDAQRLHIVLTAMSFFPYERLSESKLTKIVDGQFTLFCSQSRPLFMWSAMDVVFDGTIVLISKLLHRSKAVRLALYTMLTDSLRFWRTKELLCKAAAMLTLGLGDIDSSCVTVALHGLVKMVNGIISSSLLLIRDVLN
jgi:hypothetical protein